MLCQFDGLAALNLHGLDILLLLDAILLQLALGRDAGLFHLLVGDNIGDFGFPLAFGALTHQIGLLLSPAELQLFFLCKTGIFAFALDIQTQLFGLQVL